MEGKTILKVEKGEVDGDEAIILYMTDNSMYIIKSWSSYSDGMIEFDEINELPTHWFVKV